VSAVTVRRAALGATVHLHLVGAGAGERCERALAWFERVEAVASRLRADSEVVALAGRPGRWVRVSPVLLDLVQRSLEVARLTGGRFDPACGARLERAGFDRDHRTGRRVRLAPAGAEAATYRDVAVDAAGGRVRLRRPVLLDLGASAKGLAIDLAAAELHGLDGFAIDAGGDVRVGGRSPEGGPWRVGVRDPRPGGGLAAVVRLHRGAVCTSEPGARGAHLLDASTGAPAAGLASVTVVAPSAVVADVLGAAAFVVGPRAARELLRQRHVRGLLVLAGRGAGPAPPAVRPDDPARP
jgi:thiamine biosynthesis lipoprotein